MRIRNGEGCIMAGSFREFVSRGNVIDLAVAVIIGAAFTGIVTSLTEDILMPLIGWIIGDLDFSNHFIRLGDIPAGFAGDSANYAALKAAGVPMIGYGQFIGAAINFLIVAFVIYLLVRSIKRMTGERQAAPAADPAEIVLLREIRDAVRDRGA
jgi:large conductance mechanosensitive channel